MRLTRRALPSLVAALGSDFSVDEVMLQEAIDRHRSANIFCLPYFTKIDLFVRGEGEYDRAEFARQTAVQVLAGESVFASSAEDNLLWKLRGFRLGGEVSDQNWPMI